MSSMSGTGQDGRNPESERRKGRGPLVAVVTLIVVVLVGTVAFLGYERFVDNNYDDFAGGGTGQVTVEVAQGQTLAQIGQTLKDKGVVASVQSFIEAAAANPDSTSIAPGFYSLHRQMSGASAIEEMLDPANQQVVVIAVPEGLRTTQVIAIANEASGIPEAQFRAALKDADELGLPRFAGGRPEGFLFPATYEFAPDASARDIVKAMFARYDQAEEDLDFVARARKSDYTPYEMMIIASLVQAEGHPDDYGKVARVIYNRLELGMPLQLDATVNYALDTTEINLTAKQLAASSPYNTYTNQGLPPTPINQPGEAAMEAALDPELGDWLYFVAVNPDTGQTKFTDSYQEFLGFKAEFEKYIAENG